MIEEIDETKPGDWGGPFTSGFCTEVRDLKAQIKVILKEMLEGS